MRPTTLLACFLAAVLGFAGCRSLQFERPQVTTEADWLTEGDHAGRHHHADVSVAPPLAEAWIYGADGGFGPGTPLLLGDAVLVANRKGDVHAIDLETGKRLGTQEFGEAIEGSAVIENGLLYVPVAWGGTALKAYNLRTARQQWRVKGVPVEAGLLLRAGLLYAVDVESHVRAYDAEKGEVRWHRALDSLATVFATPVLTDDALLIVADDEGRVVALRPDDGELVWMQALGAPVYTTPTTTGGALFVATTRGRFFALDATRGTVRWTYTVPDTTVRFAGPAFADDTVYFGGSDGLFRALDARTGAVRWLFEAPDALTAPPLVVRESIYVGSMGRMLYALDPETGVEQWAHELKGRVKSPMVARDGLLVVLTEPRHVYLFRQEAEMAATR